MALLGLLLLATTCERRPGVAEASSTATAHTMKLESPAFANGTSIPSKHTCEGQDISPELHWSDVPEGTRSFALIVDDPDAPDPRRPKRTWVHWVLYDLPADAMRLREGAEPLPYGTRLGVNDWDRPSYGGPCPPIGEHRYFFKLYALDVVLGDLDEPNKAQLEAAMTGHVLAQIDLMGTYEKSRSFQ